MGRKIQLTRLKGVNDLSNKDYNTWRNAQVKAGKLSEWSSLEAEERLYKNQQFVKRYGEKAFRAMKAPQRDLFEQQQLNNYNNFIIKKTVAAWANPFNEDGTVDPNKGVGDADLFYKIMAMDPLHQKELYESNWKTNSEIDKLIKETKDKHFKEAMARDQDSRKWMGMGTSAVPFMHTAAYDIIGQNVDESILRGENANIYDKIFAKDAAQKEKEAQPQIQAEYNSLSSLNDEDMNNLFIEEIFPKKGKNLGVPQLAAYFNEDGTIKSDEVEDMTMDEKRMVIAKKRAYENIYGASIAYDLQDKEAKDYISDHQDWGDKAYKFGADFAVAAAAYTADMMNGVRHLWIEGGEAMNLYDSEEVECYIDANGRYLGKENVDPITSIYTDPYSGEQIPVTKTTAKRSVLDYQGIAADGTSRRAIFNNRYWSDAEATGSFDQEEHAQAKALNGYSPNKMVYKMGEDQSYLWEIAKTGSFAMVDMALAIVPGGVGFAGKGIKTLGTMGNAANAGRKTLKAIGTGLEFTSKALNEIKPFYASTGMAHMMGRGTLEESITDNMSAIDNLLRSEGQQEYQKIMGHKSMESGDPLYNREMESKQVDIHNKIDKLAAIHYDKWRKEIIKQNDGKDPESLMSTAELEEVKNTFKETATREYAESYISDYVENQKTTDRYKQMVDKAAESASDAAYALATTTGIQYGLVNALGYRKYLYKDPTKRIQSTASKRIREAFTDPNTGKLTIKSIYDGVSKGQNIKNFAKVAVSQMAKEGIEEAGDELHTYGAKQINEDAMSKYLNNEFSADAEAKTYSMWEGMSSYFLGAAKGLYETGTYEAATIGALSGGFNVTPNILAITSPGFRERWNKAREEKRSWLEMANMLVNNGVLNTYYDKVEGEREAKRIIQSVNQIVDKADQFKALSRGLAMNQAKLGDLSPDEDDALEFMRAVQVMNQLQEFSKEEANTLLGAASKRSDVFKTALEQVDKITSGKFTEQDAKDMLTEYYAKNPSVPQSEENSKKALEQITQNATKLKKGVEIVNQVNDKLSSYEKKTGKKVNPLVRAQLSERSALDQFLEERIADNEEKISGYKSVNTQHNAASYGTREGVKNRISDLDHAIGDHTEVVEEHKKNSSAKKAELEQYIESLKDKDELTSEEQEKLSKLMQENKAMELDLKIAEANRNRVVTERNSLMQQEESWQDGKVMSKEEILEAHPEDRARMLSNSNRHNYSAEQLEQIDLAREELLNKDKSLLDDVILQQASNLNTHIQNKQAMSSIMEDPEAALVNMMTRTSYSAVRAASDRHNAQTMDSWVKQIEEDPDINPALQDEIIYQGLLKNHTIIDGIDRYKRGVIYNKYRHVLDRARKANSIIKIVKDYTKDLDAEGAAKNEILGTVMGILQNTSDEKEVIEKLGQMVSNQNVPAETRERLFKLLTTLEEVYQHQSKATRATKEQKEKAQKEKEAKKQAEEAERVKKEEELVKQQEEEKNKKEEERLQREKEIAEREAYGLSEEDAESKEAKLTPEQIQEGVDNGEYVELESPSIDKQIESDTSGDVSKMVAPTTDTSTLDAEVKESETGIYIGNPLYRYDKDDARIGIQRKRVGGKPNDKMNRRFAWFENEGIKLQEIIDSELHHLVKLGVKIHPLTINPQDNATNDITFKDDVLWVVEYTDQVKKIHNNDLGGVITANGKQFLIIGQAGYDGKSTEQFDSFNSLRNPQKRKRKDYFRTNPSERFYVDTSVYTQVKSISSGYLVKQQSTDTESKSRPVTELLEGNRNPRGNKISIEDLKWGIALAQDVTGNNMITVNISEEQKAKMRAVKTNRPGNTYLFVEAADGKLTPVYIKPLFLSEIRNGALKDEIVTLVNDLSSMDHAVRLKAVNQLSYYLTFSKSKDQILVGTPSKPSVSIQRNGTIVKSFDLTQPNTRTELVQFVMEEFNPRINIIAPYLKDETMIEKYAEAGALDTDIAQLGTSNASYTVYTIGEDGKPEIETIVDSTSPNVGGSDLFDSVATDVYSTTYHGKTAVKDSNGIWKINGKVVTDVIIHSQLEYHQKLDARNISPAKVTDEGEFYVVQDDINYPVIFLKKGYHIVALKGDAAKKILSEIRNEQEEVARQERIKAEREKENAETASNIDTPSTDNTNTNTQEENEVLSDEELLNQQLGVFEDGPKEKSLEEQKAEDKVDLILSNSEKFELTEDENFYRNTETGELYARVTSIEHADANSKLEDIFDPNNPYGLPSTSIGNGIDEFIRDFFDGTLGNIDNLSDRYPNATTEDLQELLGQLNTLKRQLSEKGIKIISKGIVAAGTVQVTDKQGNKKSLKVAGTLDLLGYDANGNFYVFDIKTNRSIPNPDSTFGRKKISNWSKQTSLYKEFLEKQYHIKVKSLEVIPIKVNYPTPVGATDRQGVGATEYTNEGNQLYANGVEFREAKPKLHSNIPLQETTINVQYEKLLPHEQAQVQDLAESKNIPSNQKPSQQKTSNSSNKDVNNADASLADLQAGDELNTPEAIFSSAEYGGRFFDILEKKAQEGWPIIEDMDALNDFLSKKGIEVTNIITSPDVWLDMLENCR